MDAETAAVAENGADLLGMVGDGEDHVAHTDGAEQIELMLQKRTIDHGRDGLGNLESQRAEPRPLAARQDHCLHPWQRTLTRREGGAGRLASRPRQPGTDPVASPYLTGVQAVRQIRQIDSAGRGGIVPAPRC